MEKSKRIESAILFSDGASRGNPGEGGAGVVIYDGENNKICEGVKYLGTVTNNQAEYQALVFGLQKAKKLSVQNLTIRSDSELLVRQLGGIYRVKNEGLQSLYLKVRKLLSGFRSLKIEHVVREQNKEADRLANRAVDEKKSYWR